MKNNYLKELANCFIFAFISGAAQAIGSYTATYFLEKLIDKRKKRIGF